MEGKSMKHCRAIWCAALLLVILTLTAAEAAGPLSQIGSWQSLGSRAHDIVIQGDFAYVVTDLGLKIVDLTPLPGAPPDVRGSVALGGKSLGITIAGSYVYTANVSKDLQIVDVSDPDAPVLVKSKTLPGTSWDVAVKDNIAYVASMNGELYLIDVSNPLNPVQIDVLGLLAWSHPGSDATNIAKLNNYVTAGSAKVTGVSVVGDRLFATDFNYGRIYYYNVAQANNPVFAGTHYAPFILRVDGDPAGEAVYGYSTFGGTSGIYSVLLSTMGPSFSTRHNTCGTGCDYLVSPQTDYGGLAVSANGRYVMFIGGKQGSVRVADVTDPTNMTTAGSVSIPAHGAKTAESLGVAQYGEYIIAAGGLLGVGVFHFPGLAD
jgi:hypothetical protein